MRATLQQDLFPETVVVPPSTQAVSAAEAMRRRNFKEAIKLYKQLVKDEGLPQWSEGLAQAYAARASELAARGLFEQAQILLDNTAAPDGTVRNPLLYVHCLVKRGQHQKAAEHALKYVGTGKLARDQTARLGEVAAALAVAEPCRLETPQDPQSERGKWLEQAAAARQAMAAWLEGKPQEDIDHLLSRISLRSDFKALRLILKALITAPLDPDRARQLMHTITPRSPFAALREAAEAALAAPQSGFLGSSTAANGARRSFIFQIHGLAGNGSQSLSQLAKAESSGPGSLFAYLIRQAETQPVDVRSACLNLLPRVPDRVARFEKSFGALSPFDRHRVLALAAEARKDRERAEHHWVAAAESLEAAAGPQAKLSVGVIYRHLATLAGADDDPECEESPPVVDYLERSRKADPEHLPTLLKLIGHYRSTDGLENVRRLVEEAVERFSNEAAVLLQGVEWATRAKDFDRAIGLAHRLLLLDPINASVRQRTIDLRILAAREQMHSGDADLAAKQIAEAVKLELPDAPSFRLRIVDGLIAIGRAGGREAEARLREGVALAGGGVAGWFHASLEYLLMHGASERGLLRRGLVEAQKGAPSKQEILSIALALEADAARENSAAVAPLIRQIRGWLLKGSRLDWSADEARRVAQMLWQTEAFQVLEDYARRGLARTPNAAVWRFYHVIARTRGDADKLREHEEEDLAEIADDAARCGRLADAKLIWRFLDQVGNPAPGAASQRDSNVDDMVADLLGASLRGLSPAEVRRLVGQHGAAKAARIVASKLKKSPLGVIAPAEAIHELAQEMVESVVESSATPRSRKTPAWLR
jgi:tetratricopeptide (TPR) repeat protein